MDITHPHTDHIGSLSTLILNAYWRLGIVTNVYSGDPTVSAILSLTGVMPISYKYHITNQFVPIYHDPTLKAYAIIFDEFKFVYTGDQKDPETLKQLLAKYHDYDFYVDTALMTNNVHKKPTMKPLLFRVGEGSWFTPFCVMYNMLL